MNIKENFFLERCVTSFRFAVYAIRDIKVISFFKSKEKYDLIKTQPFSMFRASLFYMFTMEYSKLLDKQHSDDNKNKQFKVASLIKANEEMSRIFGSDYDKVYGENKERLCNLSKADITNAILTLRDKKFAHLDSEILDFQTIMPFEDKTIEDIFLKLESMKAVLVSMLKFYGQEFDFSIQTEFSKTQRFIDNHLFYKKVFEEEAEKRPDLPRNLYLTSYD